MIKLEDMDMTITHLRHAVLACGLFAIAAFSHTALAWDTPTEPKPCIDIEKRVSVDGGQTYVDADTAAEAVIANAAVIYKMVVTNCGNLRVEQIYVIDEMLGVSHQAGGLLPGESLKLEHPAGDVCKDNSGQLVNTASVSGTAPYDKTSAFVSDSDDAWVECGGDQGGGEGCTPGFWKQEQHFDSWAFPYTPDTLFATVFARDIVVRGEGKTLVSDPTLLQALDANGGNVNAAARHAVAALLNAASTGVSYNLSEDAIIAAFQDAYPDGELDDMKDSFEAFNEQGCPLN